MQIRANPDPGTETATSGLSGRKKICVGVTAHVRGWAASWLSGGRFPPPRPHGHIDDDEFAVDEFYFEKFEKFTGFLIKPFRKIRNSCNSVELIRRLETIDVVAEKTRLQERSRPRGHKTPTRVHTPKKPKQKEHKKSCCKTDQSTRHRVQHPQCRTCPRPQ